MSAPVSAMGWHGELWLARDFALLQGGAGATTAHAHYAHQILLSPAAPVTVAIEGRQTIANCVLIESMCEHAVLAAPPSLFTIFAEPLAIAAHSLLATASTAQATSAALMQSLRALQRTPMPDPRITDALAEVDARLSDKVEAAALAQRVNLSLSHLERLFDAHVGLPIRPLVRWRRLRLALLLALRGQSLTDAAHGAGFSDSAHFSRTMRAMFGVRADQTLRGLNLQLID